MVHGKTFSKIVFFISYRKWGNEGTRALPKLFKVRKLNMGVANRFQYATHL